MGLICFLIRSQQIVENNAKTKDLEGSPALNSCDVTNSRPFNFCVSSQTCPKKCNEEEHHREHIIYPAETAVQQLLVDSPI